MKDRKSSPIISLEESKNHPNGNEDQCQFDGESYDHGTIICINKKDHRCRNGKWVALGTDESCKSKKM
jgi:hypothetical protein